MPRPTESLPGAVPGPTERFLINKALLVGTDGVAGEAHRASYGLLKEEPLSKIGSLKGLQSLYHPGPPNSST